MLNFKKLGVLGLATFVGTSFIGTVHATPIEDIIEAKKVTLNYVEPSNEDDVFTMIDYFAEKYSGYGLKDCNESGTQCKLYQSGNDQNILATIDIIFDYDKAIKQVADSFLKKIGNKEMTFYMNDIEAINYFYANKKYVDTHPELEQDPNFDGFALTFPSFSSELRKYFEYSNFDVRVGLGTDAPYYQIQGGNIQFWYDGVLYGSGPLTKVVLPYVVYIEEDATNIIEAIKARLGSYYEIDSVEKDTIKTVEQIIIEGRQEFADMWDNNGVSPDVKEEFHNNKDEYLEARMDEFYYNENGEAHFLTRAINDRYTITFKDGWATTLAVVKDNEQARDTRKVITNDAGTGIEISTEGLIPMDTLIQVARITSGDEYDKIVKILNNNNVDMFDLKLYSTSEEKFITELENGKFKVKLPIKEEFQGKDLKVYYVDADGKKEEYDVKISEDGKYATFETDHFSIYTLAVTGTTKNPKTGDNLVLYLLVLTTSGYALYKARKFN